MAIIQEVTDWEFPNHIYQTKNGRLIAYMIQGTNDVVRFSKPKGLRFEKSRRKFVNVTDKTIIQKFEGDRIE